MNPVFQHITEAKICELIASAEHRLTLYSPGVSKAVALSLADAAGRGVIVRFLTDISPYALRLGFFDKDALRLLSAVSQNNNTGLTMLNTPGIRQGVLVVDNRSWAFAVYSRVLENSQSSCWSFPNGLEFLQPANTEDALPIETMPITSEMLGNAINVLSEEAHSQETIQDYEERCRLQKIEFMVQNYKIQNCSIRLKPELLIDIRDVRRMKMTYALYEKGEPLPNVSADFICVNDGKEERGSITLDGLQAIIDAIRERFIYSLGSPYGNVILLDDKPAFEAALKRLETIGIALHNALQDVLRQKAVDVLKVLYQELHQRRAIKEDDEQRFLDEMQNEIKRVSEKVFDLKCIRNYTLFQAKDYESVDFQEAVWNMLLERRRRLTAASQKQYQIAEWNMLFECCDKGEKPIEVFHDDVKIVFPPLELILSKKQSSDYRVL